MIAVLTACMTLTVPLTASALWWSGDDPRVSVNTALNWTGGGVPGGVSRANNLDTGGGGNLRQRIIDILNAAIGLLGVLCVVTLVIGGLILVTGQGSDESREKVRKIVLYTIVGLILVLFAKAVVDLYTSIVLS